MSFDGSSSSSTVDDVVEAIPIGRPRSPMVRRRATQKQDATTGDGNLHRGTVDAGEGSGLDSVEMTAKPFVVEGDLRAFVRWVEQRKLTFIVNYVAEILREILHSSVVTASLDTEPDDPEVSRVMLVATVRVDDEQALDHLFGFTGMPWWLGIVRSTRNAVVVDIQRG